MKHKVVNFKVMGKVGLVTLVSATILGAGELGSSQLGQRLGLDNTAFTSPTVAKADSNNTFTYDGESITVTSISEGGTVKPTSSVGSDGTLNYVMSVPIGHKIQASDYLSAKGTVGSSTEEQDLTTDQINAAVAAGIISVRYNSSTDLGYEGAAVVGFVSFNGSQYMLCAYSATAVVPENAIAYTDSQGLVYKLFTDDSGNNVAYISGSTGTAKASTSLAIPATVQYGGTTYAVTNILKNAVLSAKTLTTLDLSNATNLQSIGQGSFMAAPITEIILPDSVRSLGSNTFMNGGKLTKFVAGTDLSTLGQMTVANNELKYISIPDNVTVGINAFRYQSPSMTASTTPTSDEAQIISTPSGLQLPLANLITYNIGGKSQLDSIGATVTSDSGVTYDDKTQTFTIDPSVTTFSFAFASNLPGSFGGTYTVTVNNGKDTVTPQDQTIDPGDTLPDAASYIHSITDADGNTVDPTTAAGDGSLKLTYPDGTPDTNTPGTYEVDLTYTDGSDTYTAIAHLTITKPADSSSSSDSSASTNGGGTTTGNSSANSVTSSSSSSSAATDSSSTGSDTVTTTSADTVSVGEKVYAKKALYLYSKPTFSKTNRVTGYAKKTRIYAPIFTVKSTTTSANGVLRYKVTTENGKSGYITANSAYTAPLYWKGNYSKLYVINPSGTYAYKSQTFKKANRVKLLKQSTSVKVVKVIKYGLTTRYKLANGTYISGNKQWTSPTKPTFPTKVTNRSALNLYSDKNLTHKVKHYTSKTKHVFTVKKWDYSHGRAQHKGNTLRYKVAGGYISGNSSLVKTVK